MEEVRISEITFGAYGGEGSALMGTFISPYRWSRFREFSQAAMSQALRFYPASRSSAVLGRVNL
jgi:hypothetical protein